MVNRMMKIKKKNEKKTHFILKKKCAKYKSVSSAELFANVF